MNETERIRRRRERLRQELEDADVPLDFDDDRGQRILHELDYARFPHRHERDFPTYGALVVNDRSQLRAWTDLMVTDAGGCSPHALRLLADGRQSFVLVSAGHADLATFLSARDRETDLVRLQRQSPPDLVIVQRTAHGIVRAFIHGLLIEWDGARWWTRSYADAYVREVLRCVPDCPRDVLAAILEFCLHTLAPAPAGAALVWLLDDHGADQLGHLRRPQPPVALPALSLLDPRTHGALRQMLAQIDGATIVDHQGNVLETGVHLIGSERSAALIGTRPGRGTRHGSARRFSFDEPRTVVFVVSEDGPVTVFSDGAIAASIDNLGRDQLPRPTSQDGAAATSDVRGVRIIHCSTCRTRLGASRDTGTEERVDECPVCSASIPSPWADASCRLWAVKAPSP
ncbi:MAG: diadenylate cyclase [Acidimicrobiales bacterium]